MFFQSNKRKSDNDLYNKNAKNFIPIVCHYDKYSLLTKNGNLIQTIQINGINSEHISEELFNLKYKLRESINKHIHNSEEFAFWIHTLRRKTNLDDNTQHNNLFSKHLHNLWRKKNYWDDKFVNTLYLSIVYKSSNISSTNIFSVNVKKNIATAHDAYLDSALSKLEQFTLKILKDLESYGAARLGIRYQGDKVFSDSLFLYRRIAHLREDNNELPLSDLSDYLGHYQYAIGSDKIEVIDSNDKNFGAILSIKEYHEIPKEKLDLFLQLPIEMITTEIIHFVGEKEARDAFKYQDQILKISGDEELRVATNIKAIMEVESRAKFCMQQISILIIEDTVDMLENAIKKASKMLSSIGVVHVREDIHLEQTFWAQLPGNFSFIRRTNYITIDNIAAIASLHNFPTGNKYGKWGRALTILRTEKGTPYFANLHDKSHRSNVALLGSKKSGKTTLINFLISESTKYSPNIAYITYGKDAKIFINAIGGRWIDSAKSLINPLLCENSEDGRGFLLEFFKIICGHYIQELMDSEIGFLNKFIDYIFTLNSENRKLSVLISEFDFASEEGLLIKSKLSALDNVNGQHKAFFDVDYSTHSALFLNHNVTAVDFNDMSDHLFINMYEPEDQSLLEAFRQDLLKHYSIKSAFIYAFSYFFTRQEKHKKILVLNKLEYNLSKEYFANVLINIYDIASKFDCATLTSFSLDAVDKNDESKYKKWINAINLQFLFPSQAKAEDLKKLLDLNDKEVSKLDEIRSKLYMFLSREEGQSITLELSLGGLYGAIKMLSCGDLELKKFNNLIDEAQGKNDEWVMQLYEQLS